MTKLSSDPGPLKAYELVMAFAARRGEAALRLAMHAALAQVLRAELLHLIRLNFLPEATYDLAIEADVLFAPFCEDMGNGYYCFAANARVQLLQGLDPAYRDESMPRSVQVARFMLDYLDHEERDIRTGSDRLRSHWIDVERWSALAFAEPALAAGQLAKALALATANNDIAARVRIGGLASALTTPLARFGELLTYAEGVEAQQMGRADDAHRLFAAMPDREIEIAGIRLKSPRRVLAEGREREASAVQAAELSDQAEARAESQGEQLEVEVVVEEERLHRGAEEAQRKAEEEQKWAEQPALGRVAKEAWRKAKEVVGRWAMGERVQYENHRYDVFVSYAHADNEKPLGSAAQYGWVTTLAHNLNTGPGHYRKNLFIDHRLKPGDVFSDDLVMTVGNSTLLLLLLSQNYIDSRWCGDELDHFVRIHANNPDKPADVFVVELAPFHILVNVPANIQKLRERLIHAQFWYRPAGASAPQLAGYPTPQESGPEGEHRYWLVLDELRNAIDSRLRDSRSALRSGQPISTAAKEAVVVCDIFISYTSEDRDRVRSLAQALERQGWSVWWDRRIPAGRSFDEVIEEALNASKAVVVVWTTTSVKSSWVKNVAREGLRRRVLFPVRLLEEVEIPLEFEHIQVAQLMDWQLGKAHSGFDQFVEDIAQVVGPPSEADVQQTSLNQSKGKPLTQREPASDMVKVPKGPFLYGVDKTRETIDYDYWIDKYPVTNKKYQAFIEAGGYENQQYWSPDGWRWKTLNDITGPEYWNNEQWNKHDYPVVGVSYYEAEAYSKWAGKRLPTEQEWEKAARGNSGRQYPWGEEFDKNRCNSFESGIRHTTPVTQYRSGVSPYGCYDMAGNVWEWCSSWYHESLGRRVTRGGERVIRGGSWDVSPGLLRVSFRFRFDVGDRNDIIGFRLAQDLP